MASSKSLTGRPHVGPLVLSVQRGLSRADDPDAIHSDAAFNAVKPIVKTRDNSSCVYCGFTADKWQDYHHVDGDHRNNHPSNIVIVCRLCHLSQHVGYVGSCDYGCLINCPEIDQAGLNNIVRSLWVGKHGGDADIRKQSTAALESLLSQAEVARKTFSFDSLLQFANELISQPNSRYEQREKYLRAPRILFYEKGFQDYIMYWCSETYKNTPTRDWLKILESHIPDTTA